ncbi:hypothetical protein [Microbacterium sp. Marseille-Q6965]|uniref:hypothetical protein n=1 Tax=Microbacterium sp. Marseille-Q6965 TaxID=2965072 RepID=UPI0021B79754|nr:hypothetical protein [Microbacterium sp. Marseille-Q6965]
MKKSAPFAVIALSALALTACSGGGSGATGGPEVGTEPPVSFSAAEWALPVEPQGTWLNSMANDTVRVDFYQLGIEAATEDSAWADTETDEPLFVAGDDVVLLQTVITNVGEEEVVLPHGQGDGLFDFAENEYLQVSPESYLTGLLEEYGVPSDSRDFDSPAVQEQTGNDNMALAAGESASYGEVYWYAGEQDYTMGFSIDRVVDGEVPDYEDHIISGNVPLPIEP